MNWYSMLKQGLTVLKHRLNGLPWLMEGYAYLNKRQFRWNLEQCAPNVGGWPWQILGAIREVATVWEEPKICFVCVCVCVCPANNARFRRFSVRKKFTTFQHNNVVGEAVKTFGTEFWKFYHGVVFSKNASIAENISRSCNSRPS